MFSLAAPQRGLVHLLLSVCFLAPGAQAQHDDPKGSILGLSEKHLHRSYPELKGLRPADTQDDLPKILERVAANETLLLHNIPNLSSREEVVQERVDYDTGGSLRGFPLFTGHYSYLVLAHAEGDGVRLNEYRTDPRGKETGPGMAGSSSLTQGFALLPLHFHPFHQAAADFRYLGRQVLDGHETYVVAFAQQPHKAQLTGIINVAGTVVAIAYQGIAWIEPDNFQIVRMRTDLLEPRPEVGLRAQTTEIHFSETRLPGLATPLWLPRDVVVTSSANGRVLRNRHHYSDYKKFVAESKIMPATEPPDEKKR